MSTKIILTSGTSWTVPSDWNSGSNTIEVLGGGGSGGAYSSGFPQGAGGGGYAKISNLALTPGASIPIVIGAGGAAVGPSSGTNFSGNAGGTTSFGSGPYLQATGGGGGSTGGSGSGGVGTASGGTTYTGGNGGGSGATPGGGGGAAGMNGNGGNGNSSTGGTGDNGTTAQGANGTEWGSSPAYGSGGGGNGASGTAQAGGTYGAGGGSATTGGALSGAGTQGLIVITYDSATATKYWVGGTGNWDASTTTHWAESSGGSGGTAIPTSTNPVFFDGNSGGGTTTITATANCANLTLTGYTGTLTGSSALNVYGNMTLIASAFTVTGTLTFASTSTGQTITTAGNTLPAVTFNGSGGGWTFQDTWTSGSITVTAGSVNLGNQNITSTGEISTALGTTLTLGTGIITLSGTGTVWNATSSTITANTSTIKITDASSSSKTFSGGTNTYGTLWLTGSGTGAYTIEDSNIFGTFKIDTPPHTINFTAGTTQTISNGSNFIVSGTAGNLITMQSTTSGQAWNIESSSQVSVDYVSLQDSHATYI